jgi:hypothetical protein
MVTAITSGPSATPRCSGEVRGIFYWDMNIVKIIHYKSGCRCALLNRKATGEEILIGIRIAIKL